MLNYQRNWLKHLKNEDEFYNYRNAKFEASELINRAVRNYLWLTNKKTSEMDRYLSSDT